MRQAKVLGWIIGGCIVLLGACLLAVWLLVNPNHYKPQIAAAVLQATGRELRLTGDIRLSVFPWIALEVDQASLGNPPGFGAEPFVSFSHAAVRVKLWPLLRERLEISRIEIDGLDLRLQKNAAGMGNWQVAGAAPATQGTTASTAHPGAVQSMQALPEVEVRRGRVSYQNIVVENFELESGSMAEQRHVPISMAFDANRGIANERITVRATFDLSEDADRLQFASVNLSGTVSRPGDGRPVHWDVVAPTLDVDLKEQSVKTSAFAVSYSVARVTGSLAGAHVLDAPAVTGSLVIAPLVLHEFMPRLGIDLPKTRDAKALADVSGSSDFAFDATGLNLDNLRFKLDDTQLQGHLKLSTPGSGALQFDLSVDRIDLNRYLAPDAARPPENTAATAATHEASPLPALDGVLRVASLKFSTLEFNALSVTVASDHAVTRLFPIAASIDGGRYSGNITYDTQGAVPSLSVDEHLASVDMQRLLVNTAQRGRISGQANVDLKGSARGATAAGLLKSLNGQFDANLSNGAIEGIDMGYEVSVAQSLLDRRGTASRQDTKRTRFDAFRMSAQITSGVAQTRDVTISSDVLKVTGQGTANLSTKAIDFALLANVLKSTTDAGVDIPLKITGTYADPTIRPDLEAVAKGQLKQKLQDVLKKNGLQGLFGR